MLEFRIVRNTVTETPVRTIEPAGGSIKMESASTGKTDFHIELRGELSAPLFLKPLM
jgi:hypothetical protein